MKNKKGFTLIELLAIIVILAIIAVITVPIILNIIENSRRGAVIDSSYGYKDGLEKFYVTGIINDTNGELPSGYRLLSQLPNGFSVSGEQPTDGWIKLEKGRVIDYSLQYGDYVVDFDDEINSGVATKNGDIRTLTCSDIGIETSSIAESLNGTLGADCAKYLDSAISIHFNPVSGSICTSGTDGCMDWHLYSVKGNYANMLLDYNISDRNSSDGAWTKQNDYSLGLTEIRTNGYVTGYLRGEGEGSKAVSADVTYPESVTEFSSFSNGYTSRGPLTTLNFLKNYTKDWGTGVPMVPNLTSADEYIIPASENYNKYQINYSKYHARLITLDEIKNLGCSTTNNSCQSFLALNLWSSSTNTNPQGYWTSSISDNFKSAYYVHYLVNYFNSAFGNPVSFGVRPVITVPIANVLPSN